MKQSLTKKLNEQTNFLSEPNRRNSRVPPETFYVDSLKVPKCFFFIVIESWKLISNIYKTKFVCSLFVGVKYCQITKSCLCHSRA